MEKLSMCVGWGQILLILILVFLLFGAGRLPVIMKDLARGLKAFKDGLEDDKKNDKSGD